MKAKIEKIVKPIEGDEPGLVDIEIQDFICPMTVEVYDSMPALNSTVDGNIILYAFSDYRVYDNDADYYARSNNSMSHQSIIPMGYFPIDQQENFEKSSVNYINGSVISVEESDDNYLVELECCDMIFYAIYKSQYGKKPSVGNIISSRYWAELSIQNK